MADDFKFRKQLNDELKGLDEFLIGKDAQALCIVFDIGSKGVRALVAPKMSLAEFTELDSKLDNLFHQVTSDINLGDELKVDKEVVNLESVPFKNTLTFLEQIKSRLHSAPIENFKVIGTEVLRRMKNRKEAKNKIEEVINIAIDIIEDTTEAYYSLLPIQYTFEKISKRQIPVAPASQNDVFLMCDMGGGSTEISYFAQSYSKQKALLPLSEIGTLKLKDIFWNGGNAGNKSKTRSGTISQSLNTIREHVTKEINEVAELPNVVIAGYNLRIYGTGTALKNCFEIYYPSTKSPHGFRGWSISLVDMKRIYSEIERKLSSKYYSVEALSFAYNLISRPNKKLKDETDFLYSLPVYISLLEILNVDAISYSYYNMKYGIFLHHFVDGVKENETFVPMTIAD